MTEPIGTPGVTPSPVVFPDSVRTPGPDHRAATPTAPNKAAWRTALQTFVPAAIALLLILPGVLQQILDGFGRQLPPGIYTVLVSITAGVTLVAAIAARLMANPAVIAWTRKYAPFFAPTKTPGS